MTCHDHCHGCLTHEQVTNYVENLVNQMIICGSIQAGLRSCGGCEETILPGGTNIVTCEQLASLVEQAIQDGSIDIPGIESFTLDGTQLELVDQAGITHRVDLASLLDKTVQNFTLDAAGQLVLTLKDGTEYKLDLKALLAEMVNGASIKSGLLDQNGNLVLTDGKGNLIEVDMSALKPIVIDRESPLTGNGTEENPLGLDLTKICWAVIEEMHFTEEGLVIQIANQCDPVTLPLDEILAVLNNKVKVCTTNQGIIIGDGSEGSCLQLDLSKLVDLLVNNTTLINNIANALNYKVKVAVTQGVTGDGTTANPLNVKLSTDSGNLLSLRNNGLYYGTVAEANVTHLYVDPVAGDDTNTGTRAAPLKTLQQAIDRVRTDQSNTIHLRAGQEFYYTGMTVNGGATRLIVPYGDPYWDGDRYPTDYPSPEVPHFYPEILENLQRPTIRSWVHYNTQSHIISTAGMNPTNGGTIQILGCNIDAKPINDVDTGHPSIPAEYTSDWPRYNTGMIYGNQAGVVNLRGCTLEVPLAPANGYDYAHNTGGLPADEITWWTIFDSNAEGNVAAIQLNHCNWTEGGNVRLMGLTAAGARLYNTAWPSNPAAITSRPGYETMPSNLGARLVEEKALSGITRDGDGKPRNILTNFVL